jgi:hypothetical protein
MQMGGFFILYRHIIEILEKKLETPKGITLKREKGAQDDEG